MSENLGFKALKISKNLVTKGGIKKYDATFPRNIMVSGLISVWSFNLEWLMIPPGCQHAFVAKYEVEHSKMKVR